MRLSEQAISSARIEAGPAWAYGCNDCRFGLVNAPPIDGPGNIAQQRRLQFENGELDCCTSCVAGEYWRMYFARYDEDANASEADRLNAVFRAVGVPPRFSELTFKTFMALAGHDPGKISAAQTVREYYDKGHVPSIGGDLPGILLYGPPGVGKTGILSPLFVSLVRNGKTGMWVQYNNLMASLRDFESGEVGSRIERCQNVDLLFLDDFGDPASERSATDYARDVMFRIIDHRHAHNMAMFVTTNLDLDKMTGQFHERITRRLLEVCAAVEMGGAKMSELKKAEM